MVVAVNKLDLLVCNIAAGTPALEALPRLNPVFAKLMLPEQAAILFNQTNTCHLLAHCKKGLVWRSK